MVAVTAQQQEWAGVENREQAPSDPVVPTLVAKAGTQGRPQGPQPRGEDSSSLGCGPRPPGCALPTGAGDLAL